MSGPSSNKMRSAFPLSWITNYLTTRVAVKRPTVERNPLKFSSSIVLPTKIVLPDMELVESNLPLKINVPISQQQVPSGNSISLVKLTRLLVVCDHAAGRGVVMSFLSGPASRSRMEPEPLACASKIKFFPSTPGRLNLTCQRPARFSCGGEAIACIPGRATTDIRINEVKKDFIVILPNQIQTLEETLSEMDSSPSTNTQQCHSESNRSWQEKSRPARARTGFLRESDCCLFQEAVDSWLSDLLLVRRRREHSRSDVTD
jgi:hypothetical protein